MAPWLEPRTAYLHIPFCAHHCGYCDFAVAAGQDHLIDLYLEALAAELATLGQPRPVESRFIGGGTPTHLSAWQLARLFEMVQTWLPLVCAGGKRWPLDDDMPGSGGESQNQQEVGIAVVPEYSIEANPDSLTEEKCAVLAAGGVTRVSLGVQSFRPETLAALDRRHAPEHVARAVVAVRKHIPVLSIDLIFGVPGSTLADWQADLEAALAYEPEHISTYGLTYEKGTPLWKKRHRGAIVPIPEADELAMYEYAMDRLAAAGFQHYEISNFARPGFRCRHNERYWANEAYYGFGVGAARYINGERALNIRDTKLYIRQALAGEPTTFQRETLGPRARAIETMATQLRRADGIDRAAFSAQTGFDLDALVGPTLGFLGDAGILTDTGTGVQLTRRGKCVADAAIAALLKAAGTE